MLADNFQSVTPKKSTSRDEFYVNHTILKEMQKRRKRDAELKSRSFWVKTGNHSGVIPTGDHQNSPIPWYVDEGITLARPINIIPESATIGCICFNGAQTIICAGG